MNFLRSVFNLDGSSFHLRRAMQQGMMFLSALSTCKLRGTFTDIVAKLKTIIASTFGFHNIKAFQY